VRRIVVAAALVLAACGGSDEASTDVPSTTATTRAPTSTTAATTSTTAAPSTSTSFVDFGETEGCTPEFWAANTHLWDDDADPLIGDEPALRPDSTLDTAFSRRQRGIEPWAGAAPAVEPYRNLTLLDALELDGSDAVERLLRAAAAAYLNAGYETMEFPFRRFQTGENGNPSLSEQLGPVLASGDDADLSALADRLEAANGLVCPL
jgi:hypothetical protein